MAPKKGDEILQTIQKNWLRNGYGNSIKSFCAFEKEATDGVMVVPWGSATNLCTEPPKELPANHRTIVKPRGVKDFAYLEFLFAYQDVMGLSTTNAGGESLSAAILPPGSPRSGFTLAMFKDADRSVALSCDAAAAPPPPVPIREGELWNLARLSSATVKASSALYFAPAPSMHTIEHLNDGWYSNCRSWIANDMPAWVEISFGTSQYHS